MLNLTLEQAEVVADQISKNVDDLNEAMERLYQLRDNGETEDEWIYTTAISCIQDKFNEDFKTLDELREYIKNADQKQ